MPPLEEGEDNSGDQFSLYFGHRLSPTHQPLFETSDCWPLSSRFALHGLRALELEKRSQKLDTERSSTESPKVLGNGKSARSLGAGAMTTKFLDNKICTFKILLSWRFPRKNSVLGRFSSLPPRPSPSKAKILFLLSSRRL